jgi:hypothetical protein
MRQLSDARLTGRFLRLKQRGGGFKPTEFDLDSRARLPPHAAQHSALLRQRPPRMPPD